MRLRALAVIMFCFLVIGSFVIIFLNERCAASGNEIYVDDNWHSGTPNGTAEHPYSSIQHAINIASEGDTIYVFGGTYNQTLLIDKNVTLIGSIDGGNTIVYRGATHDYTVDITADFVTLESFTISDTANKNRVALVRVRSNNVVIQGNNVTHSNGWGIRLDSSDGNTLGNNIINDTRGIYLSSSSNNVFSNNRINNCSEAAIKLTSSSNETIIYNNNFHNNKYGILTQSSSNNNISKNTIKDSNIDGIKLYGGNNNTVLGNVISNSNANGINLDSFNSTVRNNTVNNNQIGINLVQSSCDIINNSIYNSHIWGIYACSGSKDNLIYLNDFVGNDKNSEENGNNQWYYGTQGNYWDDYNEVDRDLDGIGDTSYAKGGCVDLYPLGHFLKPPSKPTTPSPSDGAEDVGLSVTLSVTVSDSDSSEMDVYFYHASNDELYGVDYDVQSSGTASCSFNLPFDTVFTWYAIANDSKLENQSDIWYFTTKGRPPENKKPVADAGGPYTATIGQAVIFNASGSSDPDGDIDFYRWNFGDGTSEILDISPTHSYSNLGTYEVVLTVIDTNGTSDTETTTVTITSSDGTTNQTPVADAGGPYSGNVGGIINFDGSYSYDPDSDGAITNYTWDFGDGNKGYGISTTHSYSKAGTYIINLTVTDNQGNTDKTSTTVTIEATSSYNRTPGFEFVFAVLAAAIILLLKKKKKQ